ncbi:MAG: glycosyltransferase family 1 protein, partial [Candidatus Omnitrophica bacterium]|nr:glycosyltransferase family 1 protein [Candidatus Omnitrophota bacterium]
SRVIQLISNNELRDRLGYTGRQMVEQNYTKDIVTRNTLDVYKKLL